MSAAANLKPDKPLKPRRTLFIILLIVFFLWVGALLAMYFKTIYPHRAAHPDTRSIPRGV